jgi:hypothetical protein
MGPKLRQKPKLSSVHEKREDLVTIREDEISPNELSMLQDWLEEDGTVVETSSSFIQPAEVPVKLDPSGRMQLARRLLPLLGEAQRPTIHYPKSLETYQPDLARDAEGSANSDSESEGELHPGYCLTQNQSIYGSFIYPILPHRYDTVPYKIQ